ncbi:MAG: DUF3820 family protein, partial [Candidatus Margulisbacteria bacterium]|nr:DUF3820 family protein [Candidatus Margulisiibacteriota bacterium]
MPFIPGRIGSGNRLSEIRDFAFMSEELQPDPEIFRKLLTVTMPFGKYAGTKLINLP